MSFLDNIAKISARKRFTAEYDFGDGPETLTFQALTYEERKKTFTARNKVIGVDKDGKDIIGIDVANEALDMNAEVLAASWIREDGKCVATKSAFMKEWDSDLVDALATICMAAIGMHKKKTAVVEGEPEANPSIP